MESITREEARRLAVAGRQRASKLNLEDIYIRIKGATTFGKVSITVHPEDMLPEVKQELLENKYIIAPPKDDINCHYTVYWGYEDDPDEQLLSKKDIEEAFN